MQHPHLTQLQQNRGIHITHGNRPFWPSLLKYFPLYSLSWIWSYLKCDLRHIRSKNTLEEPLIVATHTANKRNDIFQYKYQNRQAHRGVQSIYFSLYDATNLIRKTPSFGRDSASFSRGWNIGIEKGASEKKFVLLPPPQSIKSNYATKKFLPHHFASHCSPVIPSLKTV